MSLTERLLIGFAVAAMVVYAATPYAIVVADRLRFYDKPVGYKGHARPTPYLGGAAVMAGFIVALLLTAGHWGRTVPLIGGVALLWAVGTIDDRRTVRPAWRVLVELALAWMVWDSGLGWHLHAGGSRRSRRHLRVDHRGRQRLQPLRQHGWGGQHDGARGLRGRGHPRRGARRCLARGRRRVAGRRLPGLPPAQPVPARADLPGRRREHADGLRRGGAGDGRRDHLGNRLAIVAGGAPARRDSGLGHEPRDRLPPPSRRVDRQRRAGPPHPSRAQVPAERPRSRLDAGSRSGGRVCGGRARHPGRLVVHRDRCDPLPARGGCRDHGPGDAAGRGVRLGGAGGDRCDRAPTPA